MISSLAALIDSKDPEEIAKLCQLVEDYGNELLALHQSYNLHTSEELLELVATYKKMRVSAEKAFKKEA